MLVERPLRPLSTASPNLPLRHQVPGRKINRRLAAADDLSDQRPASQLVRDINRLLNQRLAMGRDQRDVIRHSGEAGQIAENVVRDVLRETLPLRYGVAKGKLTNPEGALSRHLDVIIYDTLNYPTLFIDENRNQIIPIEGAYAVIEVKSSTSKSALTEAFEELSSVASLHPGKCRSSNRLVDFFPPILKILSLHDKRTLDTIHANFVELNERYPQAFSSSSYSAESPGAKRMTGETYMIHDITVAEKGTVYHMLNGSTAVGRWGDATIGLMLSSLLDMLDQIELTRHSPFRYLSWLHAGRREIYEPETTRPPYRG